MQGRHSPKETTTITTATKKPHGGRRPGGGRKPKGDAPLVSQINLWLTQRQLDYLLCAVALKLDSQDIVRMALDKWIDEQAGGPGI